MTVADGQQIGGFRVISAIRGGKGSQGAVVRAVCERPTVPGVAVGEVVALKTMTVRDEDGSSYLSLAKRTKMLSEIVHPNVVRYRGCFSESGPFSSLHVIVMEFLEGETLKDRLAANPGGLDADEAVRIVEGTLAGLGAAAQAGIVHRDIKPGNIFICRDGTVKLIDFEIARKEGGTVSTASGRFAGTFDYMAPEFSNPSFRGDERSDVFSAGVVFHEALTGEVPYAREKEKGEQADFAFLSRWSQRQEGLCAIRIRTTVKRLLARADEVIRRALEVDPQKRYQSAAEFAAAVRTIRFRELRSPSHAYRLLRVIGRGGFGEVFKARIRGTNDFVAVKHLLKSAYGDRFRREARVMRQLDDPAFVRFVDYFEAGNAGGEEAFLVMGYLPGMPGMSLRDAIRARDEVPMPRKDVLKAFARYAHALATMHGQGIYHRDIKPANLYYPKGRPEAAAIMDLGIARDVNGTATTGQVPGTLDYMPPEIVLGSGRGDAGMDIYALGLCLYEAITGKTAYPRLPAGPSALAAFYERARAKMRPVFEHPEIAASPKLRLLLEDMTALDQFSRLSSAEAVFRRIMELLDADEGFAAVPAQLLRPVQASRPLPARPSSSASPASFVRQSSSVRSSSPARPSAPARSASPVRPAPRKEAATIMTSQTDEGRSPGAAVPRRPASSSRTVKVVVALSVLAALVVGAILAMDPAGRWFDGYRKSAAERRRQRIAEEVRRRRMADEEAEHRRAEGVRRNAVSEADEVVKKFEGYADSAIAAGNSAAEWILKWRGSEDARPLFAEQTNRFAVAAAARTARDKRDADSANRVKAAREAADVAAAYRGSDLSTADCNARASSWNETWKPLLGKRVYGELSSQIAGALVERRNRDAAELSAKAEAKSRAAALADAEKLAVEQTDAIVRKFADDGVSTAVARAEYAIWQNEWGKYGAEPFFRKCRERIDKAAAERSLAESGRAVKAECERWLANIWSATADNVRNWRTNLDRAGLELKKAVGEGRISGKDAEDMRARIETCRGWAVGVVDNKTHLPLTFAGRSIAPVSSATVVFTNGVPDGLAVTSEGYEPFRVREWDFDSNVTVIMPKSLRESVGGAKARVPRFPDGVICLVDGVECSPGIVEVRPGSHHVVWRSTKETYPGVRDYRDQDMLFVATKNEVAEVPGPSPIWTRSAELESAAQNAKQVKHGRELVGRIEALLVPEPLETRRSRLDKAYGVLSDWKTSSALAVLGERVELDLKSSYEAEKRRVRGYVRNKTGVPASLKTDVAEVTVPPGGREVVTFEAKWSGQAYASLPGYEFVFLPNARDDFDGKEFVIDAARLVPLPVKVMVPPLGEGATCMLDGKEVPGVVEIRPGTYDCVYRKPDCKTQKFEVTIRVGEDTTLPPPKRWEPSSAFSAFTEAMEAFASGAAGVTKDMVDKIGTIEDPAKRRELDELRKAVELRERLGEGEGGAR